PVRRGVRAALRAAGRPGLCGPRPTSPDLVSGARNRGGNSGAQAAPGRVVVGPGTTEVPGPPPPCQPPPGSPDLSTEFRAQDTGETMSIIVEDDAAAHPPTEGGGSAAVLARTSRGRLVLRRLRRNRLAMLGVLVIVLLYLA